MKNHVNFSERMPAMLPILKNCFRSVLIFSLFLMIPIMPVHGQETSSVPSKPALYDFGLGRCPSCKEMERILTAIRNRYGSQLEIRLLYADKEKELFEKYKIVAVPTQVFLDASGKEVDRHIGLLPESSLIKKLNDLNFISN